MTLPQITESLSRVPSGGIITDENRFDEKFLHSAIHTFRAETVRRIYNVNKLLNPIYLQKYYLEYSKKMQDEKKVVKFFAPPFIALDNETDGVRYVGSIDFSEAWTRIQSRGQLSNYNNHSVMNLRCGRFIGALYDAALQQWEIYGNADVREGLVEAVFSIPTDIPTYNMNLDNYPMTENDIVVMKELLMKQEGNIIVNTTPDLLSNSADLTAQIKKAVFAKKYI